MASVSLRKIKEALTAQLRTDSRAIEVDGVGGAKVEMLLKLLFQPYTGNGTVRLTEENTRTGIKEFYISGLDADAVVLKTDHFGVTFFRSDTYNKGCDFVILTKCNNDAYAFFIDLKADVPVVPPANNKVDCTVPSGRAKAWQMIGASALLEALLHHLKQLSLINECKFKKRFVLINKCSYVSGDSASFMPPPATASLSEFPKAYFDPETFVCYKRSDGGTIHANCLI